VGESILENCLLVGPLANRTRILVTHALHVLDKTDYIYVMDEGIQVIVEQANNEVTIIPFFDDSDINLANPAIGLDGDHRRFCTSHGRTWKVGK
jgi:hypothetical protein